MIASRADPEERQLLQRYGQWYLLRRLRRRAGDQLITGQQDAGVRCRIQAAAALLDPLSAHGTTLADLSQGDLDIWLASGSIPRRWAVGMFIRWANREKLTSAHLAATRWNGPKEAIDGEARWEQARRLLREDTHTTGDRVAGLLVLLYAQTPAAISRLRTHDVGTTGSATTLRLGAEPIVLPAPLDRRVLALVATRRGQAAVGETGKSSWLFPGGRPGSPITANTLSRRLRAIGVQPRNARNARNAALLHLASELPAAVLASTLGLHISAAASWQRTAGGDWTTYAADVAHRTAFPAGERAP